MPGERPGCCGDRTGQRRGHVFWVTPRLLCQDEQRGGVLRRWDRWGGQTGDMTQDTPAPCSLTWLTCVSPPPPPPPPPPSSAGLESDDSGDVSFKDVLERKQENGVWERRWGTMWCACMFSGSRSHKQHPVWHVSKKHMSTNDQRSVEVIQVEMYPLLM